MTCIINGVNFRPFLKPKGGIKLSYEYVDGENAGRSEITGDMFFDTIAEKRRADLDCRPLTLAEAHTVLQAIKPRTVVMTYTDPEAGGDVTMTFYSNNKPITHALERPDGSTLWEGCAFPLIEV